MRLIDAHAHLADDAFKDDVDLVLMRAFEANVAAIISCAQSANELERLKSITSRYPNKIFITIGCDPTKLDEQYVEEMYSLMVRNSSSIVGIGEVGLDFYYVRDHASRDKQVKYFSMWISLAKQLKLPLVIHSRSAGKYALDVLYKESADLVLMHAFDGSANYAVNAVKRGYYFTIPTSVCFSQQKQKLAKRLPLEYMLVETDSPVLSPIKNARNEPANLHYAVEKIAEIKGISCEKVAEVTFENARKLFKLPI
ncbi:MAG: hypothetical protein DRJ31_09460 [Candidatus Methanomethylicota archaeon]|uniref:Uncharacterized protein n=1 Tax=Thermoproteota archaeon TaxID=2056631 RepID=A0A497EKZ9_9CREN|nr:MAG: hypothetical protein DRJ31_09460 [Candidatus Verstraetearchaeota archaeon]RLE51622.1 MAG: hypothetical protein DRJ33_05515 [Candidatus Verstraetearchaeota archaeon]